MKQRTAGCLQILISVLLFGSGCKSKPEPPSAEATNTPTTGKSSAKAGQAVPEIKLGTGEAFVVLEEKSANPRSWSVGGRSTSLGVVAAGNVVSLRASVGGAPFELGKPFTVGNDMSWYLTVSKDGKALHFRARDLAAREPEVGALFSYKDVLVTWADGTDKPAIADEWSCDETDTKGGKATDCAKGPAWTQDL